MAGQTFNDSGIDKSIGFLLIGVIVLAFVILMIVGMDGVEKNAKQASESVPVAPKTEVVDFAT
ncbi:hypothetical protein [Planctomicrobium sp. SH527]|uniref:hypothetical protein n=1 Tax=Planctomicrobium sp. SH527 TaxID=3448123 RepID=UPI003F5B3D70